MIAQMTKSNPQERSDNIEEFIKTVELVLDLEIKTASIPSN